MRNKLQLKLVKKGWELKKVVITVVTPECKVHATTSEDTDWKGALQLGRNQQEVEDSDFFELTTDEQVAEALRQAPFLSDVQLELLPSDHDVWRTWVSRNVLQKLLT